MTSLIFQVGWIKADTKAIQAIAMHVITNNPRVSVSHDELRAKFRLHIAGATLEDAGPYMCQINSMPVVKQVREFVLTHLLGTLAMLSHLWTQLAERVIENNLEPYSRHSDSQNFKVKLSLSKL